MLKRLRDSSVLAASGRGDDVHATFSAEPGRLYFNMTRLAHRQALADDSWLSRKT